MFHTDDDKSRSPPQNDFDLKPKPNFGVEYQESSKPPQNGNTKRTNSDKGNYKSSTSGSHHSRNQSPSTGTLKSFDFLKPTEDNEEDKKLVSIRNAEKPRNSSHKTHHKSSSFHRTEAKDHHKSSSRDHQSSSDEKKSHSSNKESRKMHKSAHSTVNVDHPEGSSSSRKDDNHQKSRSSSSKHKSDESSSEKSSDKSKRKHESSKSTHSPVSKKIKLEEPSEVEIDCSMGTSFADALGMMMPSSSKAAKQKATQKSVSSSVSSTATHTLSNESRPTAPSDERRADKPKVRIVMYLLTIYITWD